MSKTVRRHEANPEADRNARERQETKWTIILNAAVAAAGFSIQQRDNKGTIEIHHEGKIMARAPRNIPNQKTLKSVLHRLGMSLET